jgi:hypothetical protein
MADKNVKLPDGRVVAFPDGMSDDDIGKAITANMPPTASINQSNQALPSGFSPGTIGQNIKDNAAAMPGVIGNIVKGAVGGGLNTFAGIGSLASHIPGLGGLKAPAEQLRQQVAPQNGAQSGGRAVEQAGEFLVPGLGEEALAAKTAPMLSKISAIAPAAVKLGAAALTTGTLNKVQGGSFGGGVGASLGGAALGAGLRAGMKAIAPAAAESAMGIRALDRTYNRTPGQAVLDETKGLSLGSIAEQAGGKIDEYTNQLENNAANSAIPTDLQPARDVASSFVDTAALRNNDSTKNAVAKIGQQLDSRGTVPIPQFVSASEALALKRGIGDLQTSWNPATMGEFPTSAVSSTYGAMNNELANSIPDFQDLNSKISTLIPAKARAGAKDLNAGWIQKAFDRMGAHTGALAAPLAAATYGGVHGGPLGALAGGLGGLAGVELLSSPITRMAIARIANAAQPALTNPLMQAYTGAALQANRPKKSNSQ